jgi:hypothetical protein
MPGVQKPHWLPWEVHHRLLDRVEHPVGALQILDRDEQLAVEHRQEHQTRVDGSPRHRAIGRRLAEHHGAGAAVAFGASFLDPPMPGEAAQVLENRRGRPQGRARTELQTDQAAVEHERDDSVHQRLGWLAEWKMGAKVARKSPPGSGCRASRQRLTRIRVGQVRPDLARTSPADAQGC